MQTITNRRLVEHAFAVAKTNPSAKVTLAANHLLRRTKYLLKALSAPVATRNSIRISAAASPTNAGKQVAKVLTMFETLSPANKLKYIMSIKRAGGVMIAAMPRVADRHLWVWTNPPPKGLRNSN